MPERIQRRRIKGWRMPPNTVSVTRPGKWGNPFTAAAAEEAGYRDGRLAAVQHFHRWLLGSREDRARLLRGDLHELRGKNLACFCRLDQECHADVLLELANN